MSGLKFSLVVAGIVLAVSFPICSSVADIYTELKNQNKVLQTEKNALDYTMQVQANQIKAQENIIAEQRRRITDLQNEVLTLQDHNRLKSVALSRGGFPDKQRQNMAVFTITAYSPYDNQNGNQCDSNPNDTATGTKPKPGTMAVDPSVIPYGSSIVIIYDDGTVEFGKAEDCGGGVDGRHIDVFRYGYKEALKFGMRKATVIWYKEEKAK